MKKSTLKVVPPNKEDMTFVIYNDAKAGGGVYGWQPYLCPLVEGQDGNTERNGTGLVVHLPNDALGIRPNYGDRYLIKVTKLPTDMRIRKEGEREERAYKAKKRKHLKRKRS